MGNGSKLTEILKQSSTPPQRNKEINRRARDVEGRNRMGRALQSESRTAKGECMRASQNQRKHLRFFKKITLSHDQTKNIGQHRYIFSEKILRVLPESTHKKEA